MKARGAVHRGNSPWRLRIHLSYLAPLSITPTRYHLAGDRTRSGISALAIQRLDRDDRELFVEKPILPKSVGEFAFDDPWLMIVHPPDKCCRNHKHGPLLPPSPQLAPASSPLANSTTALEITGQLVLQLQWVDSGRRPKHVFPYGRGNSSGSRIVRYSVEALLTALTWARIAWNAVSPSPRRIARTTASCSIQECFGRPDTRNCARR